MADRSIAVAILIVGLSAVGLAGYLALTRRSDGPTSLQAQQSPSPVTTADTANFAHYLVGSAPWAVAQVMAGKGDHLPELPWYLHGFWASEVRGIPPSIYTATTLKDGLRQPVKFDQIRSIGDWTVIRCAGDESYQAVRVLKYAHGKSTPVELIYVNLRATGWRESPAYYNIVPMTAENLRAAARQ